MVLNFDADSPEFKEHLKNIPIEEWNKLFDLIPEIESTTVFGTVVQEPGVLGYMQDGPIVIKFHGIMHKLNLIQPFDWPGWQRGKDLLDDESTNFNELDTVTLCKMLTALIRSNRFVEGALVGNFETGIINKLIIGLKHSVENKHH